MKIKALICAAGIIIGASMITSCLNDHEYEQVYNLETSIKSFSIGILKIDKMGIDRNGKDSAYVDTINCAKYPFTINQYSRTIENKDSLPVGTRKDKVLTKIGSDTGWILYKKKNAKGEMTDTLWTETDSIDFTETVEFRVGSFTIVPSGDKFFEGRPYYVTVNVHKQDPDTLQWRKNGESLKWGNGYGANLILTKQNAVYADHKVYVFGENNDTPVIMTANIENNALSQWTNVELNGLTGINAYSAVNYCGKVYFKAADKVYAITDNSIVEEAAESPMYTFYKGYSFEQKTSSVSMPLSYNKDIIRTVALKENSAGQPADTTAVVQHYLSTENQWETIIQNNPVVCPNLKNISMLSYDGKLYAFGGANQKETILPFESFFCSRDLGLTWNEVTRKMDFPETFKEYYTDSKGNFTCFVDQNQSTGKDNFIWIIWNDGTYSQGRINRLGFKAKW